MKSLRHIICLLVFSTLTVMGLQAQDYTYHDEQLLTILNELEEKSTYRFLYREPLVAAIKLSLSAEKEMLFEALEQSLLPYDIGISVDTTRKQALIYELPQNIQNQSVSINGIVVDDETGERLPYASVTWRENKVLHGITANQTGTFSILRKFQQNVVTISVSYVGYEKETIQLNLSNQQSWRGITVRLQPSLFSSAEIIVNGTTYFNPADTVFSGLLEVGNFSPLGENNSVRALQSLPAVNTGSALNDGINIRGSSVNGFKILLDGVSVYNQSHLFGLVDSFNPDVLQNRGFFYDVTPAQFESPSGGTLALITKTGSLREYGATVGVSNTAYRATLQGPVKKGQSSFLISGRSAYMNTIDWFNNRDLIKFGLDIDRPSSASELNSSSLNDLLIRTGNNDASFYDLHAKYYMERKNGDRFQISGYLGADKSQQLYERCFIRSSNNLCPVQFSDFNQNFFRLQELETENEWGNRLISSSYQYELGNKMNGETLAGFSDYNSSFFKDDFAYQRENQGRRETILRPFGIENTLTEFKVRQSFDVSWPSVNFYSGITYYNYQLEYFEDSFRRLNFFDQTTISQFDLATQIDLMSTQNLNLNTGSRIHYYSEGDYFRWSPGIKLHVIPSSPVSMSMSYNRNHQFLNQIGLSNINTADIWLSATENQPPSQTDLFSTGLYFKLLSRTYFRIEGYVKEIKNMRLHESQTRFIPATIESEVPWYYQNDLSARGLEFLFRQQMGRFSFTQTYTLSTVEVQNSRINDGDPFHPDWDRRHQLYSLFEIKLNEKIQFNASSTFSTGTPNQLFKILEATQNPSNIELTERLNDYFRIDISLEYRSQILGDGLEASIYVFNLLDRKNDWYREFGVFVEEDPNATGRDRFSTTGLPVSVYDLGFQPSFNLRLDF